MFLSDAFINSASTCTPREVRPEVRDFSPYSPGLSIDEIRSRYGLEQVIKMASNENPLGASPMVQEAIARHAGMVFRYTQSGNPRLAKAIADHHGVSPECIVTGNGSDEVIDLIIRVRAVPGVHNVVAFNPCFSLYRLQSLLCGVEFRQADLNPDFSFNWKALRALVDENTTLVFITTPDNPSGYCPPVEEVEAFAKSLPPHCLLVIDEAYMDFCGDEKAHSLLPKITASKNTVGKKTVGAGNSELFEGFANIAILRTFSKSFGLAGIRLGYAIVHPELSDYLRRVRPPFSVNILAEEAGLAALEDSIFRAETLRTVAEGRKFLDTELEKMGCKVFPSWSNFIMCILPENSSKTAAEFFELLLQRGIIIRQLLSYGLPEYLRISVGNFEENRAFVKAAREILGLGA